MPEDARARTVDATDWVRERLSRYPDGTTEEDIGVDLRVSDGSVRAWRKKLDRNERILVKRGTWKKLQQSEGSRSSPAADPLAADLERIYREFGTPRGRLRARENLAAIIRARAIEKEIEVADRRAKALEREARAADRRAEAQRLAEHRALLICRKVSTDGESPNGDSKTTPSPEEADGSDL